MQLQNDGKRKSLKSWSKKCLKLLVEMCTFSCRDKTERSWEMNETDEQDLLPIAPNMRKREEAFCSQLGPTIKTRHLIFCPLFLHVSFSMELSLPLTLKKGFFSLVFVANESWIDCKLLGEQSSEKFLSKSYQNLEFHKTQICIFLSFFEFVTI